MIQDQDRISGKQALMLVLAGGIGTIFEVVASFAIKDAGRNGWLSVLIGYGLAAGVGTILLKLGQRFPDKNVIQYLPVVWGRLLGKMAGLVYILGWWLMTAVIIRANIELIRFFLPTTPILILLILMMVIIMYALYKGFEVFARTTEFFGIFIMLCIVLILGLVVPDVRLQNLTPVLANGFQPVLKGVVNQFAFGMETILFMAFWLPLLNKVQDAPKALAYGMAISGVLLTGLVAVFVCFTGTSLTPRVIFPIFYMSRYIQLGNFLMGLEAVFMSLWLFSSFLEIMVFYYQPVVGLAQWLNMKDYRPLIIPMTIVTIILAMLPANMIEVAKLDALKNQTIIIPLALLIPVTWVIAAVRRVKES